MLKIFSFSPNTSFWLVTKSKVEQTKCPIGRAIASFYS